MIFWSDKELNEGLVLHWAELVYGGKKMIIIYIAAQKF